MSPMPGLCISTVDTEKSMLRNAVESENVVVLHASY